MCSNCSSGESGPSRRSVLLGLSALALGAVPAMALEQREVPPAEGLQRLMGGNERFVAEQRVATDFSAGRAALAVAQYPFAAILSCSDSRVAPELVFDQGQGDIFVVRVAGNFVNADGLASLEYAVRFLGTSLIMVLGHSQCGAVDAAVKVVRDGLVLPGSLAGMVEPIKPFARAALEQSPGDPLDIAIDLNVRGAVSELSNSQPILAEQVAAGRLAVVGARYNLATGRVSLL